ncbi:Keratin, type I cytoskeletal 19 [Anabarilius grahami]|uniref:Keratin, type I cytoskeletal 19 n=1 Tax=Anabarilius grahami TaxID=495550 RepID=A0A3N0XZZ5_ANAGA|nr:Keratin, type I cytoskeletal 19 [Anabarilius grahami]
MSYSKTCAETFLKTCPETCSTTCHDTCLKTCTETCSISYPETCSDTCSKPCSFTFPKTCPETCLKTCSDTCSDTCSKPCSFTFPESCLKSCSETCSDTCSNSCSFTFPKTCPKTCPETCLKTCSETCSDTCSEPCSFTFPESCLKTCSETCSDTCSEPYSFTFPKTSPESCLKTCSETCSDTCSKPFSFTFPNTCPETSLKTCSETCSITCPETCSETCPKSFSSTFSKTCSMTSKSIIIPHHCGTAAPKAYSVYGCGFGGRTHISSCSFRSNTCSPCPSYRIDGAYRCHSGLLSGGHGERFGARIMAGGCYGRDYDYLQKTEKATMQNLNDRLASYLDKVHSLEAANATLERQIREYYEKKGPICRRDYSCYLNTIDCLQEKIKDATINNGKILLRIDNSKLAAEDFRIKYENELSIRQCVKADIDNLRRILDKTCLAKADLEMQICALQEELVYLKKNHQEDVAAIMCQLTNAKVCVEVDAGPHQDLKKVLDDIRCHYETIIDKHCREQECWFNEKMADLCKDAATSTECIETSMSRISELRRTLQSLEIELQSQISMKGALECSLAETEARYSAKIACYQKHINTFEEELCQVRSGIEQQGRDYAALLNIKSRLEQEIATYRCLLENQGIR